MEIAQQQTPNAPAMPEGFFSAIMAVTAAMMILWGWALPVFLLIWFRREKIKTETAEWT